MRKFKKKYCPKCKEIHSGTLVYNCYACGIIHPHTNWRTQSHPNNKTDLINICGEFYKSRPSMEQKIKNLSPQEVMSGVQYGMDEVKTFTPESIREDHSVIHSQQVKALSEAIE